MDALFQIIWFGCFLMIMYFLGGYLERIHYKSIEKREKELLYFLTAAEEFIPQDRTVVQSFFVTGSVVISIDYFKRVLAALRSLIGGRMLAYESLLDRARREAVLRLKEKAYLQGAHMVVSLRLETASINKKKIQASIGTIECIAYGTALILDQPLSFSTT